MNDHESALLGYKESRVSKKLYAASGELLPSSAPSSNNNRANQTQQRAFKQQVIHKAPAADRIVSSIRDLSIVNLTQSSLHQHFYQQYQDNCHLDGSASSQQQVDEDISSYWSDSTLSNCDRDSSGQLAVNRKSLNQQEHNKQTTQQGDTEYSLNQRPNQHQLNDSNNNNNIDSHISCTQLNNNNKLAGTNKNISPTTKTTTTTTTTSLSSSSSSTSSSSSSFLTKIKTSQRRCNNGGAQPRVMRKRVMANERERERTKSLNEALETLRNRLPVPEADKRSKIQTLRTAKEYIECLAEFIRISSQQQQLQHQQQHQQPNRMNQAGVNGQPMMLTDGLVGQYSIGNCNNNENNSNSNNNNCQSFVVNNNLQQSRVDNSANRNQNHQSKSPFTYQFYKFRLPIPARCD